MSIVRTRFTPHGIPMDPPWVAPVSPEEAARRERAHESFIPSLGAVVPDAVLAKLERVRGRG